MGRGIATEEELARGLRAVGDLASLSAVPRPKRDNPFATAVPGALPTPPIPKQTRVEVPPSPATEPEVPVAPADETRRSRKGGEPRTAYTDEVTVPMTAQMRNKASLLAAELQRKRSKKAERFTPNSVFRVAIQVLLESFRLERGDAPNSEGELLELVRRRLSREPPPQGPATPT